MNMCLNFILIIFFAFRALWDTGAQEEKREIWSEIHKKLV